jgi:hypothetical protein
VTDYIGNFWDIGTSGGVVHAKWTVVLTEPSGVYRSKERHAGLSDVIYVVGAHIAKTPDGVAQRAPEPLAGPQGHPTGNGSVFKSAVPHGNRYSSVRNGFVFSESQERALSRTEEDNRIGGLVRFFK